MLIRERIQSESTTNKRLSPHPAWREIRKRIQSESTTNGTERIDYSKPIQGTRRYYSFCPECGWRGDSDELLFEITKLITPRLKAAAKSLAESEVNSEEAIQEKIERIRRLTTDESAKTDAESMNIEQTRNADENEAKKEKTKQEIVMDAIENAKIREFVSTSELRDISEQHKGEFRLKDSRIKEILKRVGNALEGSVGQGKLTKADVEKVQKEVNKRLTENFGSIELKPHRENSDVTFEVVIGGKPLPWRRYCPKCKGKGQVSGWSGCYPEITLSMFAGPRASKTTALCAAMDAFLKWREQANNQNICLEFDADEKLKKKWAITQDGVPKEAEDGAQPSAKDYPLIKYRQNIRIDATETVDNELRCTFLINIDGTKLLVSVMDIAGEFVRSLARGTEDMIESMRKRYETRYKNLDYLWVLVDYATLEYTTGVSTTQEQRKKDCEGLLGYNDPSKILNVLDLNQALSNAMNMFKSLKGIVLIWGKIDALRDENGFMQRPYLLKNQPGFDDNYNQGYGVVRRSGRKLVVYDPNLIKLQSNIICTEIEKSIGKSLIETIREKTDSKAIAFITSNYGHEPRKEEGNEGDNSIEPFNTMLPLLWMIAMEGGIAVKTEKHHRFRKPEFIPKCLNTDDDKKTYLCWIGERRRREE